MITVPAGRPGAQAIALLGPTASGKSRAAQEKYFWKNSVAAYHWIKRESGQPQAG